ncbi:hypothetical protein [Elioraea sp. Yellowstone]|jgi:hypothetical protein|uniref:hypothetical protein n=1 Tax=Elioraea sp. Yellowstone TaxID=2592070 RepID=UPI0013870548|nr:hypothetical protein [Elioraea sp. Yellowstone]
MARSKSGAENKVRKTTPGKSTPASKPAKPPSRTAKGAAAPAVRPAEEARLSVAAALLRKSARRIGI